MIPANFKNLEDYQDERGFIGHRSEHGLEFGDGAQRLGSYYIALYFLMPESRAENGTHLLQALDLLYRDPQDIEMFFDSAAQYTRHWDSTKWYGDLWIMSRDNLLPIWVAASLFSADVPECGKHALRIDKLLRMRGGFAWNYRHIWPKTNDEPKMPDYLDKFLRNLISSRIAGQCSKFLWFWDLHLLVNSLLRIWQSRSEPLEVGPDLNHQLLLLFSVRVNPTFISRISKFFYERFRRPVFNERFRNIHSWQYYFRGSDAPPMDFVMEKVL